MRIQGSPDEVSAEDYARRVADEVAVRLTGALQAADQGVKLPPPSELAASLEALIVSVHGANSNDLADLLGPFWSGTRVREALRVPTRQALASRRRNGSILGLKSADGDVLYPVSQFRRRPDGQTEVKPGMVKMFRVLRSFDSWTVAVLLHTAAVELDGLSPLDWVREGKPSERLEDLAHTVAREWLSAT